MNVFVHYLKSKVAASFGDLDIVGKSPGQILVDNAASNDQKSEDMRNEKFLVLVESNQVMQILVQINFLSCPEQHLSIFVHLPNLAKENEFQALYRCTCFDGAF